MGKAMHIKCEMSINDVYISNEVHGNNKRLKFYHTINATGTILSFLVTTQISELSIKIRVFPIKIYTRLTTL